MKVDTDPVAERTDPTARTEWRDGFADPLSKGHEETVEIFPVSYRHDFPQSELGLEDGEGRLGAVAAPRECVACRLSQSFKIGF